MFEQYIKFNGKYTKIYISIIKNAKSQNREKLHYTHNDFIYYENHHILPYCMFPQFDKETWNKVLLTAREHFICHFLLYKIYNNYQMTSAFMQMCRQSDNQNRYINSKLYEIIKIEHSIKVSEFMIGNTFNNDKFGEKNGFYGKKHSQETKDKISKSKQGNKCRLGAILTQVHKDKISKANSGRLKGIPITQEHKDKISESHLGKPKSKEHRKNLSIAKMGFKPQKSPCIHCGKEYDPGNLKIHYSKMICTRSN